MSVLIDQRTRFVIQGITGNVGRFSVVSDPQGAMFAMFTPRA